MSTPHVYDHPVMPDRRRPQDKALNELTEADAIAKCRHCLDLFLDINEAESHIDDTGHRVEYFA